MKRLSKVVNIVPVIAKADTLTLEERVYFKQRVGPHLRLSPPPPLGGGRPVRDSRTQQARFLLEEKVRKG